MLRLGRTALPTDSMTDGVSLDALTLEGIAIDAYDVSNTFCDCDEDASQSDSSSSSYREPGALYHFIQHPANDTHD